MKKEIKEALQSDYKASSVLQEVLYQIVDLSCPEADGFDGIETFPDCGQCIVCTSKELIKEEL